MWLRWSSGRVASPRRHRSLLRACSDSVALVRRRTADTDTGTRERYTYTRRRVDTEQSRSGRCAHTARTYMSAWTSPRLAALRLSSPLFASLRLVSLRFVPPRSFRLASPRRTSARYQLPPTPGGRGPSRSGHSFSELQTARIVRRIHTPRNRSRKRNTQPTVTVTTPFSKNK